MESVEPQPAITQLVSRLRSRNPEERAEAVERLQAMGSAGVDAILAALAEDRKRRWKHGLTRLGKRLLILALVCLAVYCVAWMFGLDPDRWISHVPSLLHGLLYTAFVVVSQQRKDLTRGLAEFTDPRAVGPLLDSFAYQDDKLQAEAEKALTRLLPVLRADHASLLKREQRTRMNKILLSPAPKVERRKLVKAILQALEQIGDETAIAPVERLARGDGAGSDPAIRKAAQDCLPALRARAEELRTSQTLLRAAMPVAGELLIPAHGAPAASPATLLRPVVPTASENRRQAGEQAEQRESVLFQI